jgi:hypothetical protein
MITDDKNPAWLLEQAGTRRLRDGWQLVIRVDFCDPTEGRPHGLSYAMILNDQEGNRILGLDNSHAFDGAQPGDPFDHEHRPGKTGQRFPYPYTNAVQLLTDFFERVDTHCKKTGVPFLLEVEDDD